MSVKRQQNINYKKLKRLGNIRLYLSVLFGAKEDELIQRICEDICEKRKYIKLNKAQIYTCVDYCNECEMQCKKFGLNVRTIYTNANSQNYEPNHALNQIFYNGKWITFDPQKGIHCFEV